MTILKMPDSLVTLEETTPEGKLEMAAARAEVRVAQLLRKAVRVSKSSQRELAEKLGVTEGRVSQIINSEGNVRITTIARFLRAMGYRLQLEAIPADEGVPRLNSMRRAKRQNSRLKVFTLQEYHPRTRSTVIITDGNDLDGLPVESFEYYDQRQYHQPNKGGLTQVSSVVLENQSEEISEVSK